MPHDNTRPLLSLCMIVKNEAEHLETCLKLARPHVDEIVLVDTGSTDGTQDIARRYADVFEEIEWPHSFAAARNYSLDRASGKYILVLDGDEYIADPRAWEFLRNILHMEITCGRLKIRNLLPPNGFITADVMYQERIFPNDTSIRYSGKIHNQILNALHNYYKKTGYPILNLPIEVIHVGYSYDREKLKNKYLPRLPLLEQEYKEANNKIEKAYYGYQLTASYFAVGEYDQALEIFETLDHDALAKGNIDNAFYAYMIAAQAALQLKDSKRALIFCDKMLNIKKDEPASYFLGGIALIMDKQIENGILLISKAFEVNEENTSARFPINEKMILDSLIDIVTKMNLQTIKFELEKIRKTHLNGNQTFKMLLQRLQTLMVWAEQKKSLLLRGK